jgi:hypothetical protein
MIQPVKGEKFLFFLFALMGDIGKLVLAEKTFGQIFRSRDEENDIRLERDSGNFNNFGMHDFSYFWDWFYTQR